MDRCYVERKSGAEVMFMVTDQLEKEEAKSQALEEALKVSFTLLENLLNCNVIS